MTPERFEELWREHFANAQVDLELNHAVYHEDAVLEFPQSGERFEGRETFKAWRAEYPAKVDIELRRARGGDDLYIAEGVVRYDGRNPLYTVSIVEFRDDLVAHEAIYFAEPFDAPDWRRPYAAPESA